MLASTQIIPKSQIDRTTVIIAIYDFFFKFQVVNIITLLIYIALAIYFIILTKMYAILFNWNIEKKGYVAFVNYNHVTCSGFDTALDIVNKP